MTTVLAYNGLNVRICRRCGCEKTHVFNVRNDVKGLLKRRRECPACGFRWSTVEVEQITYEQLIVEDEKRAFEELQQRYDAAQRRDHP